MRVRFPHVLNSSSSAVELTENIQALVDVLHHGMDDTNFAAGTLPQSQQSQTLYPVVICSSNNYGLPQEIFDYKGAVGQERLIAVSMWAFGAAGPYQYDVDMDANLFWDNSGLTSEEHDTQFYATETVVGGNTIGQKGLLGDVVSVDRTAVGGAMFALIVLWVESL